MTALYRMLFSPSPETYPAHALYVALSSAARNPFFFTRANVADTLDGRFDVIVVHLFLALERIKREQGSETFAQALLECFFSELDRSLREMGVADLGVGRRIRKMADACKGRLARYKSDWSDATTCRQAVIANLYRGDAERAAAGIDDCIAALNNFAELLDTCSYEQLRAGELPSLRIA